jgi:holo-[acyl-carrier protein] synthase
VIVGIGVDVVDVARFEASLARTPRLLTRLFAESERGLAPQSLAARWAAKEAVVKAIGSTRVRAIDIEVVSGEHGEPRLWLHGGAAVLAEERGIRTWHVSMTHDAGVACAFVVAERADVAVGAPIGASDTGSALRSDTGSALRSDIGSAPGSAAASDPGSGLRGGSGSMSGSSAGEDAA